MPVNHLVASFCSDPENPFQVEAELKVRKALENKTDWRFEFTRHDDQYAIDVLCFKYLLQGDKFQKILLGKVEVEASKQWIEGKYPSFWKTYSYLRRKVEKWDKDTPFHIIDEVDIWHGQPWDDASQTIYLKVAQDLSDCHAVLVSDLWEYKEKKLVLDKRSGLTQDRAFYFRTSYQNCKVTKRGWNEVSDFIVSQFDIELKEGIRKTA